MKINKKVEHPAASLPAGGGAAGDQGHRASWRRRVDLIEQALWQAGRPGEPLMTPSPAWQEEVMAEIRRLGPLTGPAPTPSGPEWRWTYQPATIWAWAATVAACLVIALAGLAFSNLTADQVLAGLFLDDPADLTARELLIEL